MTLAGLEWCRPGADQAATVSLHHTSLISLILEPPLPIREPHWLAGTTSLRVTGGLLVAGLLLMELMMSWKARTARCKGQHQFKMKDKLYEQGWDYG